MKLFQENTAFFVNICLKYFFGNDMKIALLAKKHI